MTGGDVSDLARDYAGQFGLPIRREDQSTVDIQETAGKPVGARYVAGIDDLDGERDRRVGIAHDLLRKPVDVVVDQRIVDDPGIAIEGRGQAAPQFSLSCG